MANNKQMQEMLQKIKSGKMTIEQANTALERKRGITFSEIQKFTGKLEKDKCYCLRNGNVYTSPSKQTKANGEVSFLMPYFRTKNGKHISELMPK